MPEYGNCQGCATPMMLIEEGQTHHPACDPVHGITWADRVASHVERVEKARLARGVAVGATLKKYAAESAEALRIIQNYAATHEFLSANDVRPLMEVAKIPGAVRGGVFQAAVRAGVLEMVALETSEDEGTHGKDVYRYRSIVYRQDVA